MTKPFARSPFAALALASALLLTAACSTNPATGGSSFTAFMSPEKELEVGKQEHPKIVQAFGGQFPDRKMTRYIDDLGKRLAKQSELPDLKWTFTVLHDAKVNAFALPGGYVYVTRGLLALASDEAEVAGVLSHEIGHVTARHTAQRYSQAMTANIGLQVLGALGGMAADSGRLASYGAQAVLQSHSREQELESDMLGVRYMVRAGYDPQALVTFFTKLRAHQRIEALVAGKDENAAEQSSIFATHPRTADRIQQAIDLAQKNGGASQRNADAYLGMIDGMVFGDGADQGFVKGRTFTHPDLKFRFKVPAGFKIHNQPDKVVAVNKIGATVSFDIAPDADLKKADNLAGYVDKVWGKGLDLGQVRHIAVGKLNAVTATARTNTRAGRRWVRLAAIHDEATGTVYRFLFIAEPKHIKQLNAPFLSTIKSFRRLTAAQAEKLQPQRIRIIEVGAGVNTSRLINAMAVEAYKEEWFAALNGLEPGDPIAPGRKVKIVRD